MRYGSNTAEIWSRNKNMSKEALKNIRTAIFHPDNEGVIVDTVWMHFPCPETMVDYIDRELEKCNNISTEEALAELKKAMIELIDWAVDADNRIWGEWGTSVEFEAAKAVGQVPDPVIQQAMKAFEKY